MEYDVRGVGFDPYNAKDFIEQWTRENGPYSTIKVIQGAKTETVPLGELKILAGQGMLEFDQQLVSYCMGNCITIQDTNGNRKLSKMRREQKIDAVAAMMDAYVAYKSFRDRFM
jgi:phage terminase large subunit-like protein